MAKRRRFDEVLRVCPGFVGLLYTQEAHNLQEGAFYLDPARAGGGLSRLCKECHKARSREYFKTYYALHREQIIARVLAARKKRDERARLTAQS